MKPTSVIFIIVSVILCCVGLLLCVTASNLATEQGTAIFSQNGDGDNNYITTREFETEDLKKIIIKVTDVNVNVYGNSDRNAVELINFADGTYSCELPSKSMMQIIDNSGISSIIDLDNLKINFNGFRDYLNYFKYRDRVREVNLYLKEDVSVLNLSITTTGNGDVMLKDLELNKSPDDGKCYCDYNVTVDNGNVRLDGIVTASSVNVVSKGDSTIEFNNTECNGMTVEASKGYLTVKNTVFLSFMYVEIEEGSAAYYGNGRPLTNFDILYQSGSGNLMKEGERITSGIFEQRGASHVTDPETLEQQTEGKIKENSVTIIVVNGEIKID